MSREILFRAKHLNASLKNEYIGTPWVEGYLCDENHIYSTKTEGEFLIDPETVCQYTNYADIREHKAFEHDIVFYEDGGCYGNIVFRNGKFLVEWKSRPDLRNDIHFWFTKRRVYVVGNIFDNPELLEGDES